jgi:hypothetical protein
MSYNLKAGSDFFINKNSTLGFVINGNFSSSPFDNTSKTTISYTPTSEINRTLLADNTSTSSRDNLSFNFNYQYSDSLNRSLSINADHSFYNINSVQWQPNTYLDKHGAQTNQIIYETEALTDIKVYAINADYEQPFLQGKLGTGIKSSYVLTDNDFKRFNILQSTREMD